MEPITLTGYASGATLYAFPSDKSLAAWLLYRVLLTEGTGADADRYVGSVDPANGTNLVLFSGETQPASWADAVVGVGWDLLIAAIKADAELGTGAGGLVDNAVAARKLAEADDLLESVGGVQVLNKYERGTSNKLVPTKSAKKVGGGDLTNPTSQRWAGYREQP